jgi:hypothetical protein
VPFKKRSAMTQEYNYDDIRPYRDSEVVLAVKALLNESQFQSILAYIYTNKNQVKEAIASLGRVSTIEELQSFIYPICRKIIHDSTDGLSIEGLENLDKHKAYLFISNHRDIILDATFLNVALYEAGLNTTEIAIGSNLLIFDWITHLVKLNRAFVVKRNIPARELLNASKKLSIYIRNAITQRNTSVWIAQREGRTKNGDDRTQISVLKMLNMSCKNIEQGFEELHMVPLSISYEIEPCGPSKVEELLQRKYDPEFQKTAKDDLFSMAMGIENPKGRVNFCFGKPLQPVFSDPSNVNASMEELVGLIDNAIYTNFKLWPNNLIAYDMLFQKKKYSIYYNQSDIKKFNEIVEQGIAQLNAYRQEGKALLLKMYANPVIHSEKISTIGNVGKKNNN